MEWHDVEWQATEWHSVEWHDVEWQLTEWHAIEWHSVEWQRTEWHSVEWQALVCGPLADAAARRIALAVVVPAGLGGSWRWTSIGRLRA